MKAFLNSSENRAHAAAASILLLTAVVLPLLAGCSKTAPSMDLKTMQGDAQTLALQQRFGWELVSADRDDENTTTYVFRRPENYKQSVEQSVAEAGAEAKDKSRLADKDLSEVEKTASGK